MAAGSGQTMPLLSSPTNGLMWRNRYACLSRVSPAGSILSGMPTGRSPCFSTNSVVGPSHSFLISTTPGRSSAKEKCCTSLMPFTFLNPADRKVLQSKVGTSTFPASSLTSWDRLAVEDASTSSAMSDMQDTLDRRNLRLMRPKHQSGANLVWPASMKWMLMVVCWPDKTRHARYCSMKWMLMVVCRPDKTRHARYCSMSSCTGLHSCQHAGASPSHPGRTVSGSDAGS